MSRVEAPPEVREQLAALTSELRSVLAGDLVGVYLHGSAVLGCFNPQRSDVDVIALTHTPTTQAQRAELGSVMLRLSGPKERPQLAPYPLELSLLTDAQLKPWRYPTPYDFHYGESQRKRFATGAFDPLWREDHDLAAHVTVLLAEGISLAGPPVEEVFPQVPWPDYADSLLRDLAWSRERRFGLYGILNACRVWATMTERGLFSKLTGAVWALDRAPSEFRAQIARALAVYRGESDDDEFDPVEVQSYVSYVEPLARSIASR